MRNCAARLANSDDLSSKMYLSNRFQVFLFFIFFTAMTPLAWSFAHDIISNVDSRRIPPEWNLAPVPIGNVPIWWAGILVYEIMTSLSISDRIESMEGFNLVTLFVSRLDLVFCSLQGSLSSMRKPPRLIVSHRGLWSYFLSALSRQSELWKPEFCVTLLARQQAFDGIGKISSRHACPSLVKYSMSS